MKNHSSKELNRIIQKADKAARNKEYRCLYPGCDRNAIRSHSIPRSACVEALAEKGELYSLRMSFNSMMRMASPFEPLDIIKVGVNDAGTFKGYCAAHDNFLFMPAETSNRNLKNYMVISLHLRALSIEFCRKRFVLDFLKKQLQLTNNASARQELQSDIENYEVFLSSFDKIYLGSLFKMFDGSDIDKIDYFLVPFSRNLQVSCCGCFDAEPGKLDSSIGFNLISYSDMSFLALTTFTAVKHYLDTFIKAFKLPLQGEKLVNDIAFSHCEEPLIATRLWTSLTESEKLSLRLSLRHPDYRTEQTAPRIIKLVAQDFVTKLTPDILRRMPAEFGTA